jgi:Xaa-Pro aminopeptidase
VLAGWLDADRQARPTRLAALRERMAREGIDALMLTSHADARYFAGICFGPNEESTSGSSGWLLMTADALGLLVDSRYIIQAQREAPDAEHIDYGSDVGAAIGTWLHNHGARQLGAGSSGCSQFRTTFKISSLVDGLSDLRGSNFFLESVRKVKDL